MLAVALRDHRSALRASLKAEYQLELRTVLNDADTNLLDLADLVAWLPPGCALWRSYGGPTALTVEQRELRRVRFAISALEYAVRSQGPHGSQGVKQPKPDEEPPYAHEREERAAAMSNKAAAHMARQRSRPGS